MCERTTFHPELPSASWGAVTIVRRLREAGHDALLAGGCVRDLLLGLKPKDYDVATDATPDRVCEIFRITRKVGVQFGVVLVRQRRQWVEVATFRQDAEYLDGRRPTQVAFCDARTDARRRDFTINGMFFDPLACEIIDYAGGRADLDAKLVRAIGDPADRFAEDHLRLARAVRFAARLGFEVESATFAALREHAAQLALVAAERVREELEKMLGHATRGRAFELLRAAGLLWYLWKDAAWTEGQAERAAVLVARLPAGAGFELVFAAALADRDASQVGRICRELTCSNEQRERIGWLIEEQGALDDPAAISLANLKRMMAHAGFDDLYAWAKLRHEDFDDGAERSAALERRVSAIAPDAVQPPPLVNGDDLTKRRVPAGPIYKELLDELYTRQLDEELTSREEALTALEALLAERGIR